MNLIFVCIVTTNVTFFTNMMYNDMLMAMYLSCISSGIPNRVTIDYADSLLVVFPFSDHRFGSNLSSADMMSYLVTGH